MSVSASGGPDGGGAFRRRASSAKSRRAASSSSSRCPTSPPARACCGRSPSCPTRGSSASARRTRASAICAGLSFTGKRGLLLIQQTGLLDSINAIRGVAVEYNLPICMMVGLLEKEVGVMPRQSKRYGVRIVEPILEAMGIAYHNIEERRRRSENPPGHRQGLRRQQARRSPDRTEAVMMDRKKCLAAIARHVTDADIVLPVYSTAFDWIDIRPNPLNYLSHGAMGLASSHALGPRARPARQAGDRARRRRQPADEPRHAGHHRRGRAEEPVPFRLRERHLRGQRRPSDPGPRRR